MCNAHPVTISLHSLNSLKEYFISVLTVTFKETYTHRVVWVGSDLLKSSSPIPPAVSRDIFDQVRFFRAPSNLTLSVSIYNLSGMPVLSLYKNSLTYMSPKSAFFQFNINPPCSIAGGLTKNSCPQLLLACADSPDTIRKFLQGCKSQWATVMLWTILITSKYRKKQVFLSWEQCLELFHFLLQIHQCPIRIFSC